MDKTEVKKETTYDENLGISLDFGESPDDIQLEASDEVDLLESSLTTTMNNTSPKDDTGEGLFELPDGIDIDKELNTLIQDTSDSPDSTDDITKTTEPAKTTKKVEAPENKETSGSLTIAYAKSLQEQGLSDFNEEEYLKAIEEKGEAAAFIELLDKAGEDRIESRRKELDTYSQEYIKLREAGFNPEDASTLVGNYEAVSSITLERLSEDESLQEQVIRDVSILQGKANDEIDEDIQLLKDTDKLKARSEKHLQALQQYYKKAVDQELVNKQNAAAAAKKANDDYMASLKENVFNSKEILKGKQINRQTQEKIYDAIAKPVKLEDGSYTNKIWAKRKENPIEFDKRLAYLLESGIFDGSTKTLATDVRTKVVENMQKVLEGNRKFSSGSPIIASEQTMGNKIDVMKDFLEID